MTNHHFTIDVEEYFHASALEPWLHGVSGVARRSRVAGSVARILELLGQHEARATFFVLGMVAERAPDLVKGIAAAGHEVACHGWHHRRVTDQTPADFRASVRSTKALLEELTGTAVQGFRAPNFSITPGTEWALDILIQEGYGYDSSLFPIRRPGYGYPNGARDPHWLERPGGRLAELPPATLTRWGMTLPAGGGGYFRLLPYALVRSALRDFDRRGVPATFYIHPWEIDPGQPRVDVPWLTGLRHYGGLGATVGRLRRLLSEFRFGRIADTVAALA